MKRILTYDDIHNGALKLIDMIQHQGSIPDLVVGFSRGGLLPATILSHYFECQFQALAVTYRDAAATGFKYDDLKCIDALIRCNKNVIIVDDICDSGKTFIKFHEYYDDVNPQHINIDNIKTAAIHHRYTSLYTPDFIAEHIVNDDWQVYPWEVTLNKEV